MKNESTMEKVMNFADKIQGNAYLQAISTGLMRILPILMIGSIALLVAVLPIPGWADILTSIHVRPFLMVASTLTTSLLSIYASFSIGYQLAEGFKEKGFTAGIISLFAFLMLTPLTEGALSMDYMGAKGLFTAMFASLIATRLYVLFMKKNISIKMPDSVPPVISNTFSGLFPAIFTAAIFIAIAVLCSFTSFGSVANFIYTVVSLPLQNLSGSVWSLVFIVFVQMLLWFFGLHGSLVVGSFVTALYLPMDTMNMEAVAAGVANSELPNILGKTFYGIFSGIGGAGGTLSLLIVMLLVGKGKKNKALAQLAIIPGCFTINEPIVFGLPLILNPIMAIPFICVPLVQTVIAYFSIAIGLVPRLNGVQVPFGTPVILNGFLAGGWRASVLQVALIVIGVVIYYPFFKMLDRKDVREEAIEN